MSDVEDKGRLRARFGAAPPHSNVPATMSQVPGSERLGWRAVTILFVLALAARIAHAVVGDANGLFAGLFLDSRYYAERAAEIRLGTGTATGPFLMSPLYPYFLALFTDARGVLDAHAVRIAQAVAGAVTAVTAAWMATRWGGRRAGWIAGVVAALHAPTIHYGALILVPALQGAFLAAGVALLVAEPRPARANLVRAASGAAFGVAAALHPSSLTVAIATGIVAACLAGRAAKRMLAFAGGLLAVIAPFAWHNFVVANEPVLLSANGGINFWIGNQAEATGLFRAPPGYDLRTDPVGRSIAESALGHKPSFAEASSWWRDRALRDVADAPGRWAALLGRKTVLFAHSGEIPQLGENFSWFRARAWTLGFPIGSLLILVCALAAPFAIVSRRGRAAWRDLAIPCVALAVFGATIVTFFVTGRYRAPILPLAIALGAAGVVEVARHFASLTWTSMGRGLGLVGAIVVLVVAGRAAFEGSFALPSGTGSEERHQGMALYDRGRFAEAVEWYRRSLDLDDDDATRTNLANALKALGKTNEAAAEYRAVLARDPRNGMAWYNYGNLLRREMHDPRGAQDAYRRATDALPRFPEAHFNLGASLMDLGEWEPAIASIEAALSLAPPNATWREEAERALTIARAASTTSQPTTPR